MAPEEFDRLAVDKADFPLLHALKEGDIAPPLSLPTTDGQLVHSRELLRAGPVVLTFYRGVWCPYCQRDLRALAETANVINAYGASLVAIAHQTVPDSNRKFEQENNLGFPILDGTSGIAAAAFGIGRNSECLRELFEQFSTDRTGFNPEVATIVPMQAPVRHRTGRQRRVCRHQRRLPLRAGVIRGPPCAAAFAERYLMKHVAEEARNHPGRASGFPFLQHFQQRDK
jgi:peroxiredoxin